MADISTRRPNPMRWAQRVLASAAIGGLALGTGPASASAAIDPAIFVDSACTEVYPYAISGRAYGFAPNDIVSVVFVLYRTNGANSVYQTSYTMDSTGAASLGTVYEASPFRIAGIYYHEIDGVSGFGQDDELIVHTVAFIDQACTGTIAQPK